MRCSGTFRLSLAIRAVNLAADTAGEIVTLGPGSVITVRGDCSTPGFLQVLCNGKAYSLFAEDLIERAVPCKGVPSQTASSFHQRGNASRTA